MSTSNTTTDDTKSEGSDLRSVTYKIRGRVQGVYYRATAATVAQRLGLVGYVQNCRDNTVELHAQGTSQQLDQMKQWCYQGPPMANVTAVEEISPNTPTSNKSFTDFSIRR